ncbi:MAG: ABC transporter permease [Bacilli bacterium]|jgi:putative ABC transport system permease protein|nr:ABC transporter permease [Bacilli bacterium]
MFLAWKEIKHSKGKFALIMAVVALVSYLVYFLTSLAYGLASSYTNGVTKWEADNIVLTEESNDNILMSAMGDDLDDNADDYDLLTASGEKAKLGIFMAVIKDTTPNEAIEDTRADVYVFGIESNRFLNPEPTITLGDNEVIADISIQEQGYEVNDMVLISGADDLSWKIVAFTEKSTYQTAPILYMNLDTWQDYRYYGRSGIPESLSLYNAVVIRGEVTNLPEAYISYPINDFINSLPGYTAQVLTFSVMIGFLIIIVAFVLGIFIYVLTIQKTPMFGVMKAQGISNAYIANSVVSQTFLLTTIGILIGLALTLISGFFLAGTVPFAVNILFYVVITFAFIAFAIIGGLFSVRAVLKIDPLRAIS